MPRSRTPLLLLLLAQIAACGHAPQQTPRTPRHVILISVDTLRQDHVGLYGYERDTTPALDALAGESLVFERAYTTWTWTLIAHMGLLTGLHASQHGVWNKEAALPEGAPTLAERLKEAGYHTLGFHYPGWLDARHGFDRGFDVYTSHENAEEAEAHMRAALARRPPNQPLFLFVHLFDAHNAPLPERGAPYDPPAPFDQAFLPDARETLAEARARTLWEKDGNIVSKQEHEAIVALYDACIRYVDHKLGQWIDLWKDEGIYDDALLVITSDHGEGLFQRGGRYGGHGAYFEEGLVVPLLLRFPDGRFAGERAHDPVSHVDLVPTILDVLDLPPDRRLPGYSWLAGRPEHALIIAEHPRKDAEVLYDGRHKLVRAPKLDRLHAVDLESDPGEHDPLRAAEERHAFDAIATGLFERAAAERGRWIRLGKSGVAPPLDPELERRLNAMGYGGAQDH